MNQARAELMKQNMAINNIKNIVLKCQKVNSLDNIFGQIKVEKCNLLKVDCEGCEYEIFKNCSKNTFKKIKQIVMEAHLFNKQMKYEYLKLKEILRVNNFEIKEKGNPVHDYLMFLYAHKRTTLVS